MTNVHDYRNFTNRELSWLDFNMRCLNEARNRDVPLFERLKFLSITASNLDEFFTVRVASLMDQRDAKYDKLDIAGMTPKEQLDAISEKAHQFIALQYSTWNRSLLTSLRNRRLVVITQHEKLTDEQAEFVDRYFKEQVLPVLTPLAHDSSRPFPLVLNRSLNIAALVEPKNVRGKGRVFAKKHKKPSELEVRNRNIEFAMVEVPSVLPRIVRLPDTTDEHGHAVMNVILLEEVIERNMPKLFANYNIIAAHPFRVMRNAGLDIDEEDAVDLLEEIKKQLKKRRRGAVVRLDVEDTIEDRLLKLLTDELDVEKNEIYKVSGPLDLTFTMKLYDLPGFEDMKVPAYIPKPVPELENEDSIFANIRRRDIFLSHPYESFDPVVHFIQYAAKDPKVLAIKITLYRVSGNSPIVRGLEDAANNGKQVTALVELKARFDEENNIQWAQRLERAGCHVIYGLVGLKTHSKIALVVRREENGIRRYVHLATGNYNDKTAKLYSDCGLLTCRKSFGEDATAFFNMISGYSEPENWRELILAPNFLRKWLIEKIRTEAENAKAGKKCGIVAKMNSLCDEEIIAELYKASCAGVPIQLIVRGICCLKPGIQGLSENISVRSIVGNFLEHARITRFENAGEPLYFMGSADWMPRNLDRRIEIVFPLHDEEIKARAQHILDLQLEDNLKASILGEDGIYRHPDLRGKKKLDSQMAQCYEAKEAYEELLQEQDKKADHRQFIPREHVEPERGEDRKPEDPGRLI